MFNFLGKKDLTSNSSTSNGGKDFEYLSENTYYFDSACQTLRPQQVINAETEYYQSYNACGHRVKYKWGEMVDSKTERTRELLLKLVGKSSKDYLVFFCLNATSGINTILHQLNPDKFERVVTSEIEHSSIFLPSITWAKRNGKERLVLPRINDANLDYKLQDLQKAIVLVNSTNNFNGLSCGNLVEVAKDVHTQGGILLIDACQTFGHYPENLKDVDFDAAFGSGHKMYGPSIGFGIVKKELVKNLDTYIIGGSTISDNTLNDYKLIDDGEELYARLEPGLQNFAGIIGLGAAIEWRNNFKSEGGKNAHDYELELKEYLKEKLSETPELIRLSDEVSGVVSVYTKSLDGNRLALYLSERNIMCRSGYHCVYYYLLHKMKYPPLLRISLGLNNTKAEIDFLMESLKAIVKAF